jgi:hypothetical protein
LTKHPLQVEVPAAPQVRGAGAPAISIRSVPRALAVGPDDVVDFIDGRRTERVRIVPVFQFGKKKRRRQAGS